MVSTNSQTPRFAARVMHAADSFGVAFPSAFSFV
jgi:hypothetical protein